MKVVKMELSAERRIDEAFAKAEPWAGAMCNLLRNIIHQAVPEVKEEWKWGPHFSYKGMLCGIWPFKNHVSLVFFKGSVLSDPYQWLKIGENNINNRMIQFKEGEDIPERKIFEYIQEAAKNNLLGIKPVKTNKVLEIPSYFLRKLEEENVKEEFENLSYSCKKEYLQYVIEAKKEETKERRWKKILPMIREKRGLNNHYKPA